MVWPIDPLSAGLVGGRSAGVAAAGQGSIVHGCLHLQNGACQVQVSLRLGPAHLSATGGEPAPLMLVQKSQRKAEQPDAKPSSM